MGLAIQKQHSSTLIQSTLKKERSHFDSADESSNSKQILEKRLATNSTILTPDVKGTDFRGIKDIVRGSNIATISPDAKKINNDIN